MPVEQVIEDLVVEVFKKNNLDAVAKYTLIPGIQNIDAQQFEQVMSQNRITQILILRPVGETQNSPEVSLILAPISLATMRDKVVFPNPGGP